MGFSFWFAIIVQAAVVVALLAAFKEGGIGRIGVMFMITTFVYHGLTEVAQAAFPDRNSFRALTTTDGLTVFVVLVSLTMLLFTAAYLWKSRRAVRADYAETLARDLEGAYLLKPGLLICLGLVGFVLIISRSDGGDGIGGYFVAGLADQFTSLILALAVGTTCFRKSSARVLATFAIASVIIIAAGGRTQLFAILIAAICVMIRSGMKIKAKTFAAIAGILAVGFSLISMSRGAYGRFNRGESIETRLQVIADSALTESGSGDSILNDTVYRFDGNSFGAMVVDRLNDGFSPTGFPQLLNTITYMLPSFLYKGKLATDVSERNEEAYQDQHFGLPENIDYICEFWNLLLGYSGFAGFLLIAPVLGYGVALLDNWIARTPTVISYLTGITIGMIPLQIEIGVAGVFYVLRGMVVLLIIARLLTWRKRATQRQPVFVTVRSTS